MHEKLGRLNEIESDNLTLDFSKTTFSDPIASLFVIRWVDAARALGVKVTPHWGSFKEGKRVDDLDEHSRWMFYNGTSGFRSALETGYVAPFEENPKTAGRYVKYQEIKLDEFRQLREDGDDGAARLSVRNFADSLGTQAFGKSKDVQKFRRCLAELVENVVWYAGPAARCFVMSQLRPLSAPEQEGLFIKGFEAELKLEIAIADDGVGLLDTLLDSPGVNDHESAIEMAVTPGVSSTQGNDRGFGLALLREAAGLGGSMYIATNNDEDAGALVEVTPDCRPRKIHYPLSGTFVGVSILPQLVKLDEIEKRLHAQVGRMHRTLDVN
ncbi:MAG: sensor histidine kinase [bacterium]|nr:sensor histidine kinase [bacterium]